MAEEYIILYIYELHFYLYNTSLVDRHPPPQSGLTRCENDVLHLASSPCHSHIFNVTIRKRGSGLRTRLVLYYDIVYDSIINNDGMQNDTILHTAAGFYSPDRNRKPSFPYQSHSLFLSVIVHPHTYKEGEGIHHCVCERERGRRGVERGRGES